jgi:hypothetical protein
MTTKKSRLLSFKQYAKKIENVLSYRKNDVDRAYENLLYARDGFKNSTSTTFDWDAYLDNAAHNYRVSKDRLAECQAIHDNIETHYAEGIAAIKKESK